MKRALVANTRTPEIDRDRGSQRVDQSIAWLQEAGWSVTFIAQNSDGGQVHAERLRRQGVATYIGFEDAEAVLAAGDFELALLSFWEPASQLLGAIRSVSPRTRIIVDSIDVHFLREVRRVVGSGAAVDDGFGTRLAGELNTYNAADGVLTVSAKETALLADFIGSERVYDLPLGESAERSEIPFEERNGILFVGNFRHLPNGEAVEYLCRDILPRLDPELLAAHPLSVIGNRLDDKVRMHGRGMPNVRMIGWVPSVRPYLEHARVAVAPLLHGAGVKGKIIEAFMTGTPVVTTPIGAEGMALQHGRHALIGQTPSELASAIAHLLTDEPAWTEVAHEGYDLAHATYDVELVRARFLEIVDDVLARPTQGSDEESDGFRGARRRELAYLETLDAAADTLATVCDPGSTILVVSRGDDRLTTLDGRRGLHFPQTPDGDWAGYHPADSNAAIEHLEALHSTGARYFALPSPSFWWLHHYRELTVHLETHYRRIHSGEHLVIFDLATTRARVATTPVGPRRESVLVLGTYDPARTGPSPALVAEIERSERFAVTQRWSTDVAGQEPVADEPADWILRIDDSAVLPVGFVDDLLTAAARLAPLGVERVQPAHEAGPEAGPPVTERQRGVFAREVDRVTSLPVLATRRGAGAEGPVAIVDAVPIQLARHLEPEGTLTQVRDVFVVRGDEPVRSVERSGRAGSPGISVVISTHARPVLLAKCLEGFCDQTLPLAEFEVVVVDDGSPGPEVGEVLRAFAPRLALTWVHIDHSGRSAAKNLAALLAHGDTLLWFDDDDRPAADLLEVHVRGHAVNPDPGCAILGKTDWDPDLELTPVMHYVTDVDKLLFAYGNLEPGMELDWRGFWEGRISSKRAFHLRHGLHDQRLAYSIDVEMGWRLAAHGLRVVYQPAAQSFMTRAITFDDFCRRSEAKGAAQAMIAGLHDDPDLRAYTKVDEASERWRSGRVVLRERSARVRELEADSTTRALTAAELDELHASYREVFTTLNAKGVVGPEEPLTSSVSVVPAAAPVKGHDGRPLLTVTMPVWSRSEELAEMAARTLDRVFEVARMPTEVVIVDNGSPFAFADPRTRVFRYDENRGVATGWNTGIELASAAVVAVLNSDCTVEPGWDEALYEAVLDGPRIAFPYTDHCDGLGFRRPDQAGTAGWCFMLSKELFERVGPFDERFNPAYCEDTDYWHRVWELDIPLSPVPVARVVHARRTSAPDRSDWLLTAHRHLYGWKHNVEPMRAPPFYNREIADYEGRAATVAAS